MELGQNLNQAARGIRQFQVPQGSTTRSAKNFDSDTKNSIPVVINRFTAGHAGNQDVMNNRDGSIPWGMVAEFVMGQFRKGGLWGGGLI